MILRFEKGSLLSFGGPATGAKLQELFGSVLYRSMTGELEQ